MVGYPYGKFLSNPSPGEEVVVTGISGRYPKCKNIAEFQDSLFARRNLTTDVNERWDLNRHSSVLKKLGIILDLDKFDAGYFGVHHRQADIMDPLMRKFLEVSIEAIVDAGLNPSELEGTNTGVFVGTCFSDTEIDTLKKITEPQKFGPTGYLRFFIPNRISYYLKLRGPSFVVDTACSSSANALETAFRAIRNGQCENALVGGVNICMHPEISLQFSRLGVLSPDGVCKVFDQNADGYVRSDASVCVFLQKAKDARRIYGQVIHAKINDDGFKPENITFPSKQMQQDLIKDVFLDSGIHPSALSYLEAHGTGTKVGDPEEISAIDEAIAKHRQKPLWIGSVKANIGHTEPASGLCSLTKVIITMEAGRIPPNINLKKIRDSLHSILEGRLRVVTEEINLEGEDAIVGINNFGFGGNNCHLMIRRLKKMKVNGGAPEDGVPRLVCVSGRTEEAVARFFDNFNNKSLDAEYVALLHHVFKRNVETHVYRGFIIASKNGPIYSSTKLYKSPSPFYVHFGNFERSYKHVGKYLLSFPVFKDTMLKINDYLLSKNVDVVDVILRKKVDKEDLLAAIAVQIGIVDLFKALELRPTAVYGESMGKLVVKYHYETIKLEEVMLTAYKYAMSSRKQMEFTFENIISESKPSIAKRESSYFFNHNGSSDNDNVYNFKNLCNISRKATVLNVSDKLFSSKDVLNVDKDVVEFLETLGRLYEQGHNPQLHKLYPEIEYPVSRGTPMISPFIRWNYDKSWHTYKYNSCKDIKSIQTKYTINKSHEFKYVGGHVIDGRNLVPASEYLRLVWETFYTQINSINMSVVFENCKFLRAVTIPSEGSINLTITIHEFTGYFQVFEASQLVVTGWIFTPVDINTHQNNLTPFVFDESDPAQIINQDEIYRELYLRGYNYSGLFKGIIKCNVEASTGQIQWENNWTTFIDKMLQLKILQLDTRQLYVPVGLDNLTINLAKHLQCTENQDVLSVHLYEESNVIKSGGIEIRGLQAKSISKRRPLLEPVLEKYEFVPNVARLDLATSIRVNVQIVLENSLDTDFKAVEVLDSETETRYILPLVSQVLEDVPAIKPDLIISVKTTLETMPGIKVQDFVFTGTSNLNLIVGTRILKKLNLQSVLNALGPNGFVLTREELDYVPNDIEKIDVVTQFVVDDEMLILFQKQKVNEKTKYIQVRSDNLEWLTSLQQAMESEPNVVIYSQNQEFDGIMGLVNCIRREPNGKKVICFFIMGDAPEFDPQNPFYQNQIKKQLAINVYKDLKWGTYRHLLLEDPEEVECEQIRVNTLVKGDLSSLTWIQGPLTLEEPLKDEFIFIENYYSALNFRDVMIASGRIDADNFTTSRLEHEIWLGIEFSGKDKSGRRVAGMVNQSGLSTLLVADKSLLWNVPDSWTMEEAATVTIVYFTALYALLKVTVVKPGTSILIHSATGGVGLAALNICLYHGCKVFVTVGTEEKRNYLKKHFPQIPDSCIGNSRDTSFEEMVKTETRGRGVDIVLNSLTGENLIASVRCLAKGGSLLEIGKYDLAGNTSLSLLLLEKEITYHGVMLDKVHVPELKQWIVHKVEEGIRLGFVKPLPRTVFKKNEVEAAFRYMTKGKHIGKVLVKTREKESYGLEKPVKTLFRGTPRFNSNSVKCYVIIGGLGGLGLELADWLILRGAKNIVLVTSTGVKTGYQSQRISIWKSYGVNIKVSKIDVTREEGCVQLIREANALGPVDGIFNLAVVLQDALFENQTEEKFNISLAPKAYTTMYLDKVSRKLCPDLKYFVIFSSVSCGRGNAGQTNYGMANSIMERICEKRKLEGLPALAIQWGAIGDVGLVAKMQKENKELVIGGTLQQRVSSCFEVLDKFLNQNHPVVSSMVVAEKNRGNYDSGSPVDAVASILGIKDMKTISQHATLAELGMDSMMGTEVIQVLEKNFEIYITAKEVRSLTFAKLTEIENDKKNANKEEQAEKIVLGTNLLLQSLPENRASISKIIKLQSLVNDTAEATSVFVFPGVDGVLKPLEKFIRNLKAHVLGVQYNYKDPEDSIEKSAEAILPELKNHISKDKKFNFIGYSFGVLVALELANMLETDGYVGNIIAIDGSPAYTLAATKQIFPEETEEEFQTSLIIIILSIIIPTDILEKNKDKFLKCKNFDKRIDLALSLIPPNISKENLEQQGAITLYQRFKTILSYNFVHEKLNSKISLIKAKFPMVDHIDEDYQLSKLCKHPIKIYTIDGDHATILNETHLIENINQLLI